MTLLAKRGGGDPLVGVWCLLHHHLLVAVLSAAAAHADEPEEARADGEGYGKPEDGKHLAAHRSTNVVGLEDCLEDAGYGAVECCGGSGGGDGEEGLRLDEVLVWGCTDKLRE